MVREIVLHIRDTVQEGVSAIGVTVENNRFAVGHYVRTKKKLALEYAEERATLNEELINQQQQIQRLTEKVSRV